VINDRADVARMLGTGLHLGQQDLPPRHARTLMGAEGVIGFSTHNREQIESAANEPVDYVAIGPVFSTSSKDKPDPVLGVDVIRELRALTPRPLVAIGGITRENARAVLESGVDSVAVISDLIPELPLERAIRERTAEWLELVR
jgi:thiamine-phosphate pyrophosphorylase